MIAEVPAALPPRTPGQAAFSRYAGALMALPGVMWVGQNSGEPDAFRVSFQTPELARLGDQVLRDAVMGAQVKLYVGNEPLSAAARAAAPNVPWHDYAANVARAISGLEGVWGYSVVPKPNVKFIQVHTVNDAYRDFLQGLVSRTVGDGWVVNVQTRAIPPRPPAR